MDRPDYLPTDFDTPLSDDAAIMLKFVQEKKRRLTALRAEVTGIALACLLAGIWLGLQISRFAY